MIRSIIIVTLVMQFTHASTYTLKHMLGQAQEKSALKKALEKEKLSLQAQANADSTSDPFSLFLSGGRAKPDVGPSGNEYSIGGSKTIPFGGILEEERQIANLGNDAYLLEQEHNLLRFRNGLKNLYHQHCLDKQNYRMYSKNYKNFAKLYQKKVKAYQFHEIAKTELMQLELAKSRLYAKFQESKMRQEISKERLAMLSALPSGGKTEFSCRDIYPVREYVSLGETFVLSKEAYQKRLERTKKKMKRYSHAIESFDIEAQYSSEIDTDRYMIGVSMPLNFTSEKSEHARAAAMYENSAVNYKFEQSMREKKSELKQLRSMLRSYAVMLSTLQKNYTRYNKTLLPLMKKSYNLGETSVIEYLLQYQKIYELQEEIYTTKKAYYNTLFQLYTVSEKKDKK